jgi:TatA/E family protein of Tat protein translocase
MMGIGFPELMVILVIIMIIFGAGKLPEIGSAFGRSIKNFKKSMNEAEQLDQESPAPAEGKEGQVAAQGQQTAQASQSQSKEASEKEEDIIDEIAKELKENRIQPIRTKHDGLVQEGDVFTDSVKRVPFGMKRSDRGVSRDVF